MAKREKVKAEMNNNESTGNNGKHKEIVPNELNSVCEINL